MNPFDPETIPCSGSSSGSAVSVTANLIPVSIGSETSGSIIDPSAVNSVVGFKPSKGTVSTEGIFPLAEKLDMAGPIGKTVKDVALTYNAIAGKPLVSLKLDKDSLKGKTVGLADAGDKDKRQAIEKQLQALHVKVVDVSINEEGIQTGNILTQSFKKEFEDFARKQNLPIKKLKDLIAFNKKDPDRRIKYGQSDLEEAEKVKVPDTAMVEKSIKTADNILKKLFLKHKLDAIVFVDSDGVDTTAAAGYPELTIPMGMSRDKIPTGATFVTRKGQDGTLLNYGFSFETKVKGRVNPLK